jgi:hypothetical protein
LSRTENGTIIPRDYALEIAPYWLRSHPRLTFDQYISPSARQSFLQTFSVSIATKSEVEGDDSVTSIGLGVRVTPRAGTLATKTIGAIGTLDSLQRDRSLRINVREELNDSIAATTDSLAAAANQARIDALTQRLVRLRATLTAADAALTAQLDRLEDAAKAVQDADQERYGWVVQLALAGAERYAGNTFDGGSMSRFGGWGTLSYRLENPRLELISLVRYQRHLVGETQNLLDFGGRLLWMKDRLSLSYEGVSRTNFNTEVGDGTPGQVTVRLLSSSRHAGIIEYRATNDLYVTGTFGKDYKRASDSKYPVLALLGLQWNWGDKPIVGGP